MIYPGIVWTVALVALPLFAAWLEQYFGWAEWAPPFAALLLIVAKTIEVTSAHAKPPSAPPGADASFAPAPKEEPRSTAKRLLWG